MFESRTARLALPPAAHWTRWRGIGVTLGILLAIEIFAIPTPAPLYLLAIVYAAARGGKRPALWSAGLALLHAGYTAGGSRTELDTTTLFSLLTLALVMPMVALLINSTKRQEPPGTADNADGAQSTLQAPEAPGTNNGTPDEQRWLEALLNLMPTPLLLIEPGTARVTFANKAADDLAGGEFPKNAPAEAYHTVYLCTDADGRRIPNDQMPGVRAARGEQLRGFQMDWETPGGKRTLRVDSNTLPPMYGHPATVVLTFQDISALKQANAALSASEERYRAFIQHSSEAVWRFELDQPAPIAWSEDEQIDHYYRYAYLAECNDAMARMYGYTSASELIGLRLGDIMPYENPANYAYLQAFIRSGYHLADAESVELDKDGKQQYVLNNLIGIVEQDHIIRAWGTSRNITERKRAEMERTTLLERELTARAESEAAQQQVAQILESITDGFLAFDRNWHFTYANQAGALALGRPAEQLLGTQLWTEFPELAATSFGQLYQRAMAEGQPLELEDFYAPFNAWFAVRAYPSAAGLTLYFRDVTARRETEMALRESEARFRALFESAPLGLTVARQGVNLYVNPAYARIFGYDDAPELYGSSVFDHIAPQARPTIIENNRRREAGEAVPRAYDTVGLRKDGTEFPFHIEVARINLIDGPASIAFISDITERKRAEDALRFVAEASAVLTSSLDYRTTVATLTEVAVPRVADCCMIHLLTETGQIALLAVAHRDPAQTALLWELDRRYPIDPTRHDGIPLVLYSQQPEIVTAATDAYFQSFAEDDEHLARLLSLGLRSWMSLPLIARSRALGVITFMHAESGRRYQPSDTALVEEFVRRAAVAVDNALLYEAERVARRTAEQAAERAARLQAVTAALSEALTLEQVSDVIVTQGLTSIGAAAGSLYLLTADATELELVGSMGYSQEILANWSRFSASASLPIAEVIRTKQPVWIESPAAWIEDGTLSKPLLDITNSQSLAALPLWIEGRVVGAIGISFAEERVFSREDRTFMLTLAGQCAQAIARARLYEAEQQARAAAEAAEGAKDESLALLDTLLDAAPVALGFIDRTFRYIRMNTALAEIHGVQANQELGRTLGEVVPLLAPRLEQIVAEVLATGEPLRDLEISGEMPATPGQVRHWQAGYYPVRHGSGAILGVGLAAIEITERKRREETQRFLAEASALLATTLDYEATLASLARLIVPHLADWCSIDLVDQEGQIRRVVVHHVDPAKVALADELRRRYPPDPSQAQGVPAVLRSGRSSMISFISDEMLAASVRDPELLRIIRELGLTSSLTVPLQTGGRTFGAITLIAAESGRQYQADDLALAEDLARRAAVAVDNARLYQEAQQAILARDDFLSIASHELKTPLTSLQLQTQSLLRMAHKGSLVTLAPERLNNKLELINQQAVRLTKLANDVLDVARIRAGRIEFRLEQFELVAAAQEMVTRLKDQSDLAGCSVTLHADAPVPIWSDRSRLEQVFTNLLSNAVKYGSGKPIDIAISADAETARISVRDHGIGIAPEHLERIFVRFERAVSAQNYGGLGLGLYIVRQIVESLGGTIRVESETGVGSTFTVALPRTHAQR